MSAATPARITRYAARLMRHRVLAGTPAAGLLSPGDIIADPAAPGHYLVLRSIDYTPGTGSLTGDALDSVGVTGARLHDDGTYARRTLHSARLAAAAPVRMWRLVH